MSATLEQSAMMSITAADRGRFDGGVQRAAVVAVDGVRFTSPLPENAGQAETYNRIARTIVEASKS